MPSKQSTRKLKQLQPVQPSPHEIAMRRLGLDWHSIDVLADDYKSNGDDEHLVLTLVLLRRLLNLADMKANAPESLDNYLSLLIDRLYRGTWHCEGEADRFAAQADENLRAKNRPVLVSARRVSA